MMPTNTTESAAADSATPCLRVRDLRIDLPPGADRPHAVQGVSFDVMPGEVVCLLGESGSGKSVVARAVMGLLPEGLKVSGGSIALASEDLLAATPARRRELRGTGVAMVFQEPMTALNPVMRCGRQVEEMLAQHTSLGAAQRRERVLSIFARVRLPDPERIYDAYPHQLSGGQRQRIVIAMALILRPALLVCDEPTTALDVTTQAEILALVRELQHENQTAVLFITHDFGVVADIADRVVVLQLGRQVESGPKTGSCASPRRTTPACCSMPCRDWSPRSARRWRSERCCSTPAASARPMSREPGRAGAAWSRRPPMCHCRCGRARPSASWASPARASPRWRAASRG